MESDQQPNAQLHVLVLGSAAGGGSPQWNCRCRVCRCVRRGADGTEPRTQSSIAVSADGRRWVLVNASPDLRQQLLDNRQLWPAEDGRHSPIAAALLTGAEVSLDSHIMCFAAEESRLNGGRVIEMEEYRKRIEAEAAGG